MRASSTRGRTLLDIPRPPLLRALTLCPPRSSYTASLTSSVLAYPTEHGRRYHAYRPGRTHLSLPLRQSNIGTRLTGAA